MVNRKKSVVYLPDFLSGGYSRFIYMFIVFILSSCGSGGGNENNNGNEALPTNQAPIAGTVSISDDNGGNAVVGFSGTGDSLSGNYIYSDVDGDAEAVSTFRWFRNGVVINGATEITYVLVTADIGNIITFEVTPKSVNGVMQGSSVVSGGVTVVDSDSGQSLGAYSSQSVDLGDVDGDGDLDMLVGNGNISGDNNNRLYINDGTGIFADSGQLLGGYRSYGIEFGDIDGDGDLDVVVANIDSGNRIYFNNGFGSFIVSAQTLGANQSVSVTLGDVDNDGDLDMVVGNSNTGSRVYINNGSGIFTDSNQSLGINSKTDSTLGDIDGDGDLDMVVANSYTNGNRVYINNGMGTFTDSGQSLGNRNSQSVALGDLDGDSDLDLVVVNYNDVNRIYINDGGGSFTDSGQSLGSNYSLSVALGDVDADGDLDIIVANHNLGNQGNKIYINDGIANFTDSGQSLGTNSSQAVDLGDVNGDGKLDMVVGNSQGDRVYINR